MTRVKKLQFKSVGRRSYSPTFFASLLPTKLQFSNAILSALPPVLCSQRRSTILFFRSHLQKARHRRSHWIFPILK
jgi:hypothetical protein